MMTAGLLVLCLMLIAQKQLAGLAIRLFFEKPIPTAVSVPKLISILQPILSGDPTLPHCLECNLRQTCRYPTEFLWLVDADDLAGQEICRGLMEKYPDRTVRLLLQPPPPDRCNPKMVKLQAGIPEAQGDVICVLDDDTMLPAEGLETTTAYLDQPQAGLAFGLPYYVSFDNFWSGLVAYFVNSHSLQTYLPPLWFVEPFTINGMFYVFKRDIYQQIGGFTGLEQIVADDFAVARKFSESGLRLMQTPVLHPISTHVTGLRHYARLLQRWFIFPRETVLKYLPWKCLVVTYCLSLLPALGPLLFLLLWLNIRSQGTVYGGLTYLTVHYASFAACNLRYLRGASPWKWSWLVVVVQCLLPLQLLVALISPQRINWRGHLMQIERGGTFRFVRRRGP